MSPGVLCSKQRHFSASLPFLPLPPPRPPNSYHGNFLGKLLQFPFDLCRHQPCEFGNSPCKHILTQAGNFVTVFRVTVVFSSSSTAGDACRGGFHLLSLVFPDREMFQVPLLSRKSLFILAFPKELGSGA